MAKVVITIEDEDDGQVSINCEAEPPFPGPSTKGQAFTSEAHRIGITLMRTFSRALDDAYHNDGPE